MLRIRHGVSTPQYTRVLSGNLYNDLALVTLQEAVDTDKFSHIGPVCLPHHAQVTHHIAAVLQFMF